MPNVMIPAVSAAALCLAVRTAAKNGGKTDAVVEILFPNMKGKTDAPEFGEYRSYVTAQSSLIRKALVQQGVAEGKSKDEAEKLADRIIPKFRKTGGSKPQIKLSELAELANLLDADDDVEDDELMEDDSDDSDE